MSTPVSKDSGRKRGRTVAIVLGAAVTAIVIVVATNFAEPGRTPLHLIILAALMFAINLLIKKLIPPLKGIAKSKRRPWDGPDP